MSSNKLPLRKVTWIDSASQGGWRRLNETDNDPVVVESVGYVLYNNAKAITLVQSVAKHGDVNACMTIPKACVQSIRRIK